MSNHVTVKRFNKILTVPEERLAYYLSEGYDQIENGKVVKRATGGRTIPLGEYNKLVDRVKELETENAALRALIEETEDEGTDGTESKKRKKKNQ